jgi:hypothetical protein
LVIVNVVFSQWLLLPTSGLLLVKSTSHETVEDVDTLTVLLVVDLVAGDAAFVSVKVSAAFRTEPLVTPQLSSE